MESVFPWLRELTLGLVLGWMLMEVLGRGRRGFVLLPLSTLTALLAWRGLRIGFLPLTTRYEAFLGFAAALLLVAALRFPRTGRAGRGLLSLVTAVFVGTTLQFDADLQYPTPLLYTAWYAIHVPLSFLAYAFWVVGAADGVDFLVTGDAATLLTRQEENHRVGLALFSLSLVFGSIWGIVSWGAYFLWDAKIVWSLAAWLFFATLLHLKYWPLRSAPLRAGLGLLGLVVVLIAYVGTSFMSGSIHSF
ncbi:MAG: hypothetical protein D6798_01285 [Deltaproteobacteria bacterium]|nr:MAG: hypothetical protein D6798_01285 [Deltaproteobacteria bacterium]